MRHDFDAIPEAAGRRNGVGSLLTRMYRDIGLAAVADALGLLTAEFEGDLAQSIERGVYFLLPTAPALRIDLAA
ncbi:hypothetical protein DFR50_12629 [Roseiarcus fermentans]|uniref:Uncharacterized protein n=1 Tax=Roseiarcus fermentans TaxID=1473586 RepID=A0A366F0Q6_9HYPH|nr:hypothetical protein [Roseiarcus fermentans]RBP08184.1 hypothetical protein DFR50_12629 [Roseiarcus fermentans]